MKLLSELNTDKGVGLIERKKQDQGPPGYMSSVSLRGSCRSNLREEIKENIEYEHPPERFRSCGRHEEKMGQRGVPVSDVVLEDVRVPKSCMIGEKDLGFINAMKTLSVGRIGVASMCLGMAAEAIELAVEHTKNRVQFGKPLCKHQAIAFMLAEMETKLNAARGLVYNAAWLMDNGVKADKKASMAKYFAAESAIDIINKSLQLHGGYGYSREYEIERLYRDIRVCSIYEGSSQVQQIVISGQMLK